MARLTIRNISKSFAGTSAVAGFSLDVEDGELVCLLGPSGSGKSTLLRMIGGFEAPSGGAVLIDGEDVTQMQPERRPTGMVFQSHALWSHMNVHANVAFGLKLRRIPRADIRERVEAALDLVGLGGLGQRRTWQLSGGQQQRVALARSLVLEPKILLLDEPFASIDQHLRERLREEVRDIQQRLGITTLFVTHGQDEALAMADRIVVMRDGRVEQIAPADRIYRDPQTQFVAGFIGQMNFLHAEVRKGEFQHPQFTLAIPVTDGPAVLAFRPEGITLTRGTARNAGLVHRATDFGNHVMVDIDLPGGERIKAMTPPGCAWRRGERAEIHITHHALFRDDRLLHAQDTATEPMQARSGAIHA